MAVTATANDLCSKMPILANLPICSLVINETHKVRALLDTGSTNTVMSLGLCRLLGLKTTPTSFSYNSVDNNAK